MASKYVGVRENTDGSWYYRIKVKSPSGKTIDTSIKQNSNGQPFLTARAAHEARVAHLALIMSEAPETPSEAPERLVRLSDVYNDYLATEAKIKAPATLRKQDSMWTNHVELKFGEREINSIDLVELNLFLAELYTNYSYKYVEGFLKFFYLLFSHAHKREWVDIYRYQRMFVTTGTRLSMPPMSQLDKEKEEDGATVYSLEEIEQIANVFDSEDGNLRLAFYLGLYAGLRIGECFALRWSNVDFENGTITIDRQMQYLDNHFCLCPVKTLTARRTFVVPTVLLEELMFARDEQKNLRKRLGKAYRDTDRVYDTLTREWIVGGDFVNRKRNGELLTINSIKYWSKKIKSLTGIQFKYHNLRHTFATECAINNVNQQMLMLMMGHKKMDTTMKYYINIVESTTLRERTKQLLDSMYDTKEIGKFFRDSD